MHRGFVQQLQEHQATAEDSGKYCEVLAPRRTHGSGAIQGTCALTRRAQIRTRETLLVCPTKAPNSAPAIFASARPSGSDSSTTSLSGGSFCYYSSECASGSCNYNMCDYLPDGDACIAIRIFWNP